MKLNDAKDPAPAVSEATITGPVPGDAAAVVTRIKVADTHVTLAAAVPARVTEVMSFAPRLTPTIVKTVPPLLGPCRGVTLVIEIANNKHY